MSITLDAADIQCLHATHPADACPMKSVPGQASRAGRTLTSVMVSHETHADLAEIRVAMSREASKRVTMDEVVRKLLDCWNEAS